MKPQVEVGCGVFIPLTQEENNDLWDFLKEHEYEDSPQGLKKYLLGLIYEDDKSDPSKLDINTLLKENPELLQYGAKGVKAVLNLLIKKRGTG